MFRAHRAVPALSSLSRTTALVAAFVAFFIAAQTAAAADAMSSEGSIEQRIPALVPSFEAYASENMKSFDVPGLAIGIVAGDKLTPRVSASGGRGRAPGGD